MSSGFPTRSDTYQPVQPQKKARNLKFKKMRDCTIMLSWETKMLIVYMDVKIFNVINEKIAVYSWHVFIMNQLCYRCSTESSIYLC